MGSATSSVSVCLLAIEHMTMSATTLQNKGTLYNKVLFVNLSKCIN